MTDILDYWENNYRFSVGENDKDFFIVYRYFIALYILPLGSIPFDISSKQ